MHSKLLRAVLTSLLAVEMLTGPAMPQSQSAKMVPRFTTVNPEFPINPAVYRDLGKAGKALPTWGAFFQYNNQFYGFDMIGTDPSLGSATSKIKLVVIPVAVRFSDGTVLDPTMPVQCRSSESALSLFEGSPILKKIHWVQGGTNVGKTQYLDAFQRAEWWNFANGSAPDYHVIFHPVIKDKATINVPAREGKTIQGKRCGVYGDVNGFFFDAKIHDIMVKRRLQPNELPFFLTYDVVQDHGVLGYHSTLYTTLYAVATYNDRPFGKNHAFRDMVPASHVLGATLNNPFLHNLTPNWKSSLAPQLGCERLLEVGEPLAGLAEPVKVPGNPHQYYVQDLAFELWFAKAGASTSVNGWFSMFGTFADTTTNLNCH